MKWKLEKRKISDLQVFHKNPRKLTKNQYEHLKKSIDKFGLIDKPIVTKDNILIGGHQRIEVLKKENIKEVDCWIAEQDLSEKDIEELNVRLNKNTGEWDFDILANEWEILDLLNWGFSEKELCIDKEIPSQSIDIEERYLIQIECINELDQKDKFKKLEELNFPCKILKL